MFLILDQGIHLFFIKELLIPPATPPAAPAAITVEFSCPGSFKTTTTNIATSAATRTIIKIGLFFIFITFNDPTLMAFRFLPVFYKWVLDSTVFFTFPNCKTKWVITLVYGFGMIVRLRQICLIDSFMKIHCAMILNASIIRPYEV